MKYWQNNSQRKQINEALLRIYGQVTPEVKNSQSWYISKTK